MKKVFFVLFLCLPLCKGCTDNGGKAIEAKVSETVSQMTLDEKIGVVHAQSKFSSRGVPRLGVPELWCDDGPHGVRPETLWDSWAAAGWTNDSCTAYPSLTCLAASWDRDLALLYGRSVGEEARYRKKNVLLGPGVNICRTPLCGRNFEYMGEDPYLAGEMAVPYVKGVQSNNVATCVKHFALNNQEFMRSSINVNISDRALYEIYLPAFKAAVMDGGAWSVMSSYNKYQNEWVSHQPRLLKDILKGEWGFDGAVISDWGAVHSTEGAAWGGLDLEFGTHTNGVDINTANAYDAYYLADAYKQKILAGELPESELDDKVSRALRLNFRTLQGDNCGSMCSPGHFADCRKIGSEGIVLLKNSGVLPMKTEVGKVVVLGENAIRPMVVGGSSSSLKAQHEISPLQGLREAFPEAEVVYERAYVGEPKLTGNYNYGLYDLSDPRPADVILADALAAVQDADYVVFVGGLNKNKEQDCEGKDRLAYELPYGQNEVIEAIAAARPDMIYVNISGSPVAMPFVDKVGAIVQAWYLGSEAGRAIADVLTGAVNPSGKLPFTFPVALSDGPVKTERQYPGIQDEEGNWQVYYDEDIWVGYRWYDHVAVEPLFPFGYGLSYTSFEYSDLRVPGTFSDGMKVRVRVRNTGDVAGAEVVQLYVTDEEASVDRPVKELKGFGKVYLEPGESREVEFRLNRSALSYFDESAHEWVAEPGAFKVLVGSSSRDIRAEAGFRLVR
ncbi:MAG: glycoside hydrolase family 3 C-terminal domain-containing protein [Bacteroidales bacterium]|nr:glycoside hydrolase family 3 C-terminal domain-containing protein [Bacteroidales bacterium]